MAEQVLFKDFFNQRNIGVLAQGIKAGYSSFHEKDFLTFVFENFDEMSLSERSQRICAGLKAYLPNDYVESLRILRGNFGEVAQFDSLGHQDSFIYMPQALFAATYGLDYFDESMQFLYDLTRRFSSEFAIRAFLITEPSRTLARLESWVNDDCPHVRRWISEGTRPRLPWGIQLKEFVKDPSPVIALLSKLKYAEERYVEKSIANNLNDIAKDHPDLVVETLATWELEGWRNDWLKKHALRTLLKQGHAGALKALGYDAQGIECSEIQLVNDSIKLGDALEFSFNLKSESSAKIMVDFVIHHMKANGKLSPKVFKLTTCELRAEKSFSKRHVIKRITTRKYYSGKHLLEIKVNGESLRLCEFYLNCE